MTKPWTHSNCFFLLFSDSIEHLVEIADHAKEIDITVANANESNPEPNIWLLSREMLGRYCESLVISELYRNASITLADSEKLLQVELLLVFFLTSVPENLFKGKTT